GHEAAVGRGEAWHLVVGLQALGEGCAIRVRQLAAAPAQEGMPPAEAPVPRPQTPPPPPRKPPGKPKPLPNLTTEKKTGKAALNTFAELAAFFSPPPPPPAEPEKPAEPPADAPK
ncbi:MAG: hypothetical protein K2P78_12120, partial [Gemmataceae bacterium]|nr:hypothetical protein [Gemmataceae bacterium]